MAKLLLQRGYEVMHEIIRDWEFRFAPLLAEQRRLFLTRWRSLIAEPAAA